MDRLNEQARLFALLRARWVAYAGHVGNPDLWGKQFRRAWDAWDAARAKSDPVALGVTDRAGRPLWDDDEAAQLGRDAWCAGAGMDIIRCAFNACTGTEWNSCEAGYRQMEQDATAAIDAGN